MKTINLKDIYPWYTVDEYVEVTAEEAAELIQGRAAAYMAEKYG